MCVFVASVFGPWNVRRLYAYGRLGCHGCHCLRLHLRHCCGATTRSNDCAFPSCDTCRRHCPHCCCCFLRFRSDPSSNSNRNGLGRIFFCGACCAARQSAKVTASSGATTSFCAWPACGNGSAKIGGYGGTSSCALDSATGIVANGIAAFSTECAFGSET